MSKRKRRSGKRSWLSLIFGQQQKPENHEEISPLLRRDGASETITPAPEEKVRRRRSPRRSYLGGLVTVKTKPGQDNPSDVSGSQGDGPLFIINSDEQDKRLRRKRSFLSSLFGPKKKRPQKTLEVPVFNKPEERYKPPRKLRVGRNFLNTLNSTIMFVLAFVIVYLFYQMTVIFTASQFGISGVLYYYQVFWPIGNSSPLWFPYYKIILITAAGPFICLITGLLFFRIFAVQTKNPVTKLFFLWIALHSLNMFFGAFVAGVTTNDGFGYVALWLYMNIVFRILFSMIFLFALAAFGYHATKLFLETAQSPLMLKSENRREFLLFQVLFPGILGGIIIMLVRAPINPPYWIILLFTMLAATITAFLNRKAKPEHIKYFPKHHGKRLQLGYLVVLLVFLAGFRLGLEHGLHFIIRMSMSISIFGASP
jgi:hypothetical protein